VPARSAEKKSNSRLVEEIIVTAQKREENLRDVPISVAAFSGAASSNPRICSALRRGLPKANRPVLP
jgi:hypothetical protein